jgi:hypothetical protein
MAKKEQLQKKLAPPKCMGGHRTFTMGIQSKKKSSAKLKAQKLFSTEIHTQRLTNCSISIERLMNFLKKSS